MGIIIALLLLSFLIFFHELGHFSMARFFGVKVEVFSIGFGKKLFSYQKGKTLYTISAIPLGGYVKMKGQDDSDPTAKSDDKDSYTSKKPWQRLLILFAGPAFNFILAFILYMMFVFAGFKALSPVVGDIAVGSAASGILQKGDAITAINGEKIIAWEDIGKIIRSSTGSISIDVVRENKSLHLDLTPQQKLTKTIFGEPIYARMVGIAPRGDIFERRVGVAEGITLASAKTYESATLILQSVQKLITGVVAVENVGGVVSIVDITAKVSNEGWQALALLTALISVNLGVLNLLPIPALDGGHMMFTLYEMITKKVPNEETIYRLTLVGWFILGALMLLGLYNDITRLLG